MKLSKPLYTPKNLQELSKKISEKVEKKRLNIFQRLFRFLFK